MVQGQPVKENDMLKQKRFFISVVIGFSLLIISVVVYLLFHKSVTSHHSFMIYTSRPSRDVITNWIIDTDANEKWEVGKGLAAWHWSPSGQYLMFHTMSPLPIQIWISNADGSNIQKILDNGDYPQFEIKDFDWLSDDVILVNVLNKEENWFYVYSLNIKNLAFEKIDKGSFVNISPNGGFWLHYINQYYLMDVKNNTTPISYNSVVELYELKPDGMQWAYICDRKESSSSLCVADISINGISNEHKLANIEIPIQTSNVWWSQDEQYIGVQPYVRSINENRIRVIDASNGKTVYDWAFPTQTTLNFWSPRNDKIIDWNGLLLDLKTGHVNNFFEQIHETAPSYVVDWRMIKVP